MRNHYEVSSGIQALIVNYVQEQNAENLTKIFNEFGLQSNITANELKNIAIDEFRKELSNLATKEEVSNLRDEVSQIRVEMSNFATKDELKASVNMLRAEIAGVKAELKTEIAELRAENKLIRQEIKFYGIGIIVLMIILQPKVFEIITKFFS